MFLSHNHPKLFWSAIHLLMHIFIFSSINRASSTIMQRREYSSDLVWSRGNMCSVKTEIMEKGANSTLFIAKINKSDSGNYTCSINSSHEFTVLVHVLNGKQRRKSTTNQLWQCAMFIVISPNAFQIININIYIRFELRHATIHPTSKCAFLKLHGNSHLVAKKTHKSIYKTCANSLWSARWCFFFVVLENHEVVETTNNFFPSPTTPQLYTDV